MSDELLTSVQLATYAVDFATDIPEGADPAAQGYLDPPPGFHPFIIRDFELQPTKEFKEKGEVYVCAQIRPNLIIPEGYPCAGATIKDFLPMPMKGQTCSRLMMNRWYNFIAAAGFAAPKGKAAPAAFHPKQLVGKVVVAEIRQGLDENKQPKLRDDGRTQLNVAYMGYHHLDQLTELTATPAKKTQKKTTTTPVAIDL